MLGGDLAYDDRRALRASIAPVPRGRGILPWLAPGLLWMVSAVGSGAVLFTPRVAARYEYDFLWLALVVVFLMWVMIREAARYTVVSGRTLLEGFSVLPGPSGWALWVIFIPQLFAAAVGIAGLSSLVGSALRVSVGGSHVAYAVGTIVLSTLLIVVGGYRGLARIAQVMAAVLIGLSVLAAVRVAPGAVELSSGLNPLAAERPDLAFILPWVGTILAGSMGIIWYAYWTAAAGFAGPATTPGAAREDDPREEENLTADERASRAREWVRLSGTTAAVGVGLGALVIVAFMVLGSELLAPEGRIPSGVDVARDLARLVDGVWGRFGFWALIVTAVVALGGSVAANQDGWSRSFADIVRLLAARESDEDPAWSRWLQPAFLRVGFVVSITGVVPIGIVLLVEDPVSIMSASGTIGAVHTPFIVLLILLVNRLHLPDEVRPGLMSSVLLASAGVFYGAFAALRVLA